MKSIWKNVSTYLIVALVSAGTAFGTYSYLNGKNYSSADLYNYGHEFDQKNVHLASLTADGFPDFTKAAENSVHAVVHIKSTVKAQTPSRSNQRMMDPFEFFFGPGNSDDQGGYNMPQAQPAVGYGSGVIISSDGYILTNNHVIDKAANIEVTLNDNSKYTAKLIGSDPTTDIALLKIEGKALAYIPFGNSDNLKVGEWVLAVGNPFNLTSTVTAGIVSAKGRGNIGVGNGGLAIQSFIQTDAAINPGNSGGALVNTEGQLVGINTAIYSQTGSFAGYGFAVPISIAGKVVADIKEYGTVQRAVLGVSIMDIAAVKETAPDKAKNITINEGAYVGGFADHSPAKDAGIAEGDVIVSINGTKVKTVSELQEQVNRFRPGDKVKVGIKRGNADKTIDVTLKNNEGNTSIVKKADIIANIGATFKELSAEKKKLYETSYGVEVSGVSGSGLFAKAGISRGYVILKVGERKVSTPDDVESAIEAVAASSEKDKALFLTVIQPNGKVRFIAIELNAEE